MSQHVEIQFQTGSGEWITSMYMQPPVNDIELSIALKNAKNQHPSSRVRAIDSDGRLIDLIG